MSSNNNRPASLAVTAAAATTTLVVAGGIAYYLAQQAQPSLSPSSERSSKASTTTPFERWMAQVRTDKEEQDDHESKSSAPTDEQCVTLAVELYMKASPQKDIKESSKKDLIQHLSTNKDKEEKDTCCWEGVQLSWLLTEFGNLPYIQAFRQFGCPLWFVQHSSTVELIRRSLLQAGISSSTAPKNSLPLGRYLPAPALSSKPTRLIVTGDRDTTALTLDELLQQLEYHAAFHGQAKTEEYIWMEWMSCVSGNQQWMDEMPQHLREMHHVTLLLSSFHNEETTKEDADTKEPNEKEESVTTTSTGTGGWWTNLWQVVTGSSNRTLPSTLRQAKVLWYVYWAAQTGAAMEVLWPPSAKATNKGDESNPPHSWLPQAYQGLLDSVSSASDIDVTVAPLLGSTTNQKEAKQLIVAKLRQAIGMDMNRMANVWHGQGNLQAAQALYQQVLDQCCRPQDLLSLSFPSQTVKKKKHTTTTCLQLATYNNLANLYQQQEEWKDAQFLYRQVWHGFRHKLGEKHVETLQAMVQLARVLEEEDGVSEAPSCGNQTDKSLPRQEAESLYRQALAGQRKQLGNAHATTLETMYQLAELLRRQPRKAKNKNLLEAQQLYREIASCEKQPEQTDVPEQAPPSQSQQVSGRSSESNSRLALAAQHRLTQLQELSKFEQEVAKCRDTYGAQHTLTWMATDQLAHVLHKEYPPSGPEWNEAKRLYRQTLEGRRQKLGVQDYDTLESMCRLADVLFQETEQQRQQATADSTTTTNSVVASNDVVEEAESLYREAITGFERQLAASLPLQSSDSEQMRRRLLHCRYQLALLLLMTQEAGQEQGTNAAQAKKLLGEAWSQCQQDVTLQDCSLAFDIRDEMDRLSESMNRRQ